MKSTILSIVLLLITVFQNAFAFTGLYHGKIAGEKVTVVLSQLQQRISGELLGTGDIGIRLLISGSVDDSGEILGNLVDPVKKHSMVVRIIKQKNSTLSFKQLSVDPNTNEVVAEREYLLTPQKPELDRDWSLVGNWVSRQENKAISNGPSFREKVVFRGDGMMIILEGVVKSGENEVMVPGSKALQLKWRTEKKELWVSTEKADKWLKYGDYRTENDSLMLLRDLKKSKQIFLREVFK